MKKIIEFGAKRQIPNDIAFPARTRHDARWRRPKPRRGFESNKYSVELENHRMEMYSGEEKSCHTCTIFSIFFFIFAAYGCASRKFPFGK